MAVGQKEVAVWFQADQRIAGIPYRLTSNPVWDTAEH